MITAVVVDNRSAKDIAAGKRWLSSKSLIGRKPRLSGVARVSDRVGRFVCMALISPESRYYLRVISLTQENIDLDYWKNVLSRAASRREPLSNVTNSFRLIHSDADGIPSMVIEKYDDVFVLQSTSSAADSLIGDIAQAIVSLFAPRAIIERNDTLLRSKEGLPLRSGFLFGDFSEATVIEGDQKFHVDLLKGQKTGAYLDYRGFRLKGRELARGDCLDAFCYQGWFACQIAGAANKVIAVDSSASAIKAAKQNAELNKHSNIDCIRGDVFEYLVSSDSSFDFIHLDPPSFAKGGSSVAQAAAGYRKLVRLALKHLRRGGFLMVSSCSHSISERILEKWVASVCAENGIEFSVVFRGVQDRDHPVMKSHPESLYLKALAVQTKT